MVTQVEEVVVRGSAADVWGALACFGAIADWAPNVDHSCLVTEESSGVGAVRRVQVGRNALLERVVAWESGESLEYELDGLPPVVGSVANAWTVHEAGGVTTLTLTTTIEPAGSRPPQQVAARVLGKVMARASRQMIEGLRNHVERSAASPKVNP